MVERREPGGSQEGAWPESLRSSKFLMLYDTAPPCFFLTSFSKASPYQFIYPFC